MLQLSLESEFRGVVCMVKLRLFRLISAIDRDFGLDYDQS